VPKLRTGVEYQQAAALSRNENSSYSGGLWAAVPWVSLADVASRQHAACSRLNTLGAKKGSELFSLAVVGGAMPAGQGK